MHLQRIVFGHSLLTSVGKLSTQRPIGQQAIKCAHPILSRTGEQTIHAVRHDLCGHADRRAYAGHACSHILNRFEGAFAL